MMIVESGLSRRGMSATDHPPRTRGPRGTYGIGATSHDPRRRGKRSLYGVNGAWGDLLRDVVGDVANTGLDIWRGNEGQPNAGQQPPIVVVQQPAASSIPWKPILIAAGVGLAAWLIFRRKRG